MTAKLTMKAKIEMYMLKMEQEKNNYMEKCGQELQHL